MVHINKKQIIKTKNYVSYGGVQAKSKINQEYNKKSLNNMDRVLITERYKKELKQKEYCYEKSSNIYEHFMNINSPIINICNKTKILNYNFSILNLQKYNKLCILVLMNNSLTGNIKSLVKLPNLTEVDISGNLLSGEIPYLESKYLNVLNLEYNLFDELHYVNLINYYKRNLDSF